MFRSMILSISLLLSSVAMSQENVTLYTRFPSSDTSSYLTAAIVKQLNEVLSSRYSFKINVIPGSGGEAADRRALLDSELGINTIVSGTISNYTLNPIIYKSTIDRDNTFLPVELIAIIPNAIMVSPETNINKLDDLVAQIKTKNSAFKGLTIQAVSPRLLDAIFRNHFNFKNIKLVQYKFPGEITKGILINEVDYTIQNPIDTPGLRLLAISSPQRSRFFPDVPTGLELGINEFNYTSTIMWYIPSSNIRLYNQLKDHIHSACKSKELNGLATSIKIELVCNNDVAWLKNEIDRQKSIVEKYKEEIK